MNKYDSMSDKEIAEAVLLADGWEITGLERAVKCYSKDDDHKYIPNAGWEIGSAFDPCNNPEDAWSIISKNKINITWGENEGQDFIDMVSANTLNEKHEIISYDVDIRKHSALRAAMLCFLMLKEESGNA